MNNSVLQSKPNIEEYGEIEGKTVYKITLASVDGYEVQLLNYGARIHRIKSPDKNGKIEDIVLHCDSLEQYINQKAYLGAIVGRYANRINQSRFRLNGNQIKLDANEYENHLHGGTKGFDQCIWDVDKDVFKNESVVRFSLISEDGDQGYPGKLKVIVEYRFNKNNQLVIDIKAKTNKSTVVNITNHAFFNLNGSHFDDLKNHYFKIPSNQICELNNQGIPTGKLIDIDNSNWDLKESREIAEELSHLPGCLKATNGYDHCYVFSDDEELRESSLRLSCHHSISGRSLKVFSTQPGLQFYSGNYLSKSNVERVDDRDCFDHSAFCAEGQHFPDSPNHPHFPSTTLEPESEYHEQISYELGVL